MSLVTDPGVTQRLPATSLLTVDSEDRFKDYVEKRATSNSSTKSPYNFSIYANGTILGGFVRRLGVSEVVFPWVIPNVNQLTNAMTVRYSLDNGATFTDYLLTLDTGFYNPSELAAAIQDIIRNNTGLTGFTMAYGDYDTLLTQPPYNTNFQYTTGVSTQLVCFLPITSGPLFFNNTSKQLFDLLGFTGENETPEDSGGGRSTLCQYTRYVDIVSPQLTQFQGLMDGTTQQIKRDALCRIYLGDNPTMMNVAPNTASFCPPGTRPFVIYRNFNNMKNISWNANANIGNTLDFQVYDDGGTLLSDAFPNAVVNDALYADWSITILASEN